MLAALALGATLAFDLARRPENQYAARVADALIGVYQVALSPLLGRMGVRCRFVPSCSDYARAQIRARGLAAGGARSAARLVRCGPWTPFGTVDPPVAAGLLVPGEGPAAKRRPQR